MSMHHIKIFQRFVINKIILFFIQKNFAAFGPNNIRLEFVSFSDQLTTANAFFVDITQRIFCFIRINLSRFEFNCG